MEDTFVTCLDFLRFPVLRAEILKNMSGSTIHERDLVVSCVAKFLIQMLKTVGETMGVDNQKTCDELTLQFKNLFVE